MGKIGDLQQAFFFCGGGGGGKGCIQSRRKKKLMRHFVSFVMFLLLRMSPGPL